MSPIALLVAVAVVLVLGGAGLLGWGLRGRRVDDHPVCRRCGFDLFGRPEGSAVCSECGADLSGPRAVRVGRRERRPRAIAWAVGPMLAGAAWLGLVGGGAATGVDWNRHKPAWLLVREADGADAGPRDAAIAELRRRLEDGELSAPQADAVQEKALAHQADVRRPWVPAWGLLIEATRLAGKLPEDRWRRYLAHSAGLTLEVRPRVRRGDPLPIRVVRGPARVGNPNTVAAVLDVMFHLYAGNETNPENCLGTWNADLAVVGRNNLSATVLESAAAMSPETLARLSDGPQVARVTAVVLPEHFPRARTRTIPGHVERVKVELEATFALTPADQRPVSFVHDPALRAVVEKAVSVSELDYDTTTQTPRLVGMLRCDTPPVTLICDAFVRVGYAGRLWAGPLACGPGGRVTGNLAVEVPGPGMEARTVDVVLRPSVERAVRTVDVTEVWGDEIVLRGVPLRYPRDTTRATAP